MKKYVSGLGSTQVTAIYWLFHTCKLALCIVLYYHIFKPLFMTQVLVAAVVIGLDVHFVCE